MSDNPDTPFENIESAQEYVDLLLESISGTVLDVEADLALTMEPGAERRREALQLVLYKLSKLSAQMGASRRLLNDLRSLRRLLLEERLLERRASAAGSGGLGSRQH